MYPNFRVEEVKHLEVKNGKILVAISGGADSVALLCVLLEQGHSPTAALHCNFQLRGEESERDEQFVVALCKRLNVPLYIKRFDTLEYAQKKGISIEMAARELRYEWFEEQREILHADYIAVAHHREDQAETVILNLIRGTGIRGLAGMHAENGHIIRPLLSVSKQEILEYLKEIGQDFVTDSTNLERDALRNRIRLDLIPMLQSINPQAVEHIADTAHWIADALPYYLKGIKTSEGITPTTLHEQLREYGFNATQEQNIMAHIQGQSGAIFESQTHRLLRNRNGFILKSKDETELPPVLYGQIIEMEDALGFIKKSSLLPEYAYIDADKIKFPLILRHPKTGDRFRPFGMKQGTRLISDFLTDQKLSLFDKQSQWLVCSEDNIIWVKGLRIDHRYRVTEKTHRILILS